MKTRLKFIICSLLFSTITYSQDIGTNIFLQENHKTIESKLDSLIREISELKTLLRNLTPNIQENNSTNFKLDSNIFLSYPFYNWSNSVVEEDKTLTENRIEVYKPIKTYNPIEQYRREEANRKLVEDGLQLIFDLLFKYKK